MREQIAMASEALVRRRDATILEVLSEVLGYAVDDDVLLRLRNGGRISVNTNPNTLEITYFLDGKQFISFYKPVIDTTEPGMLSVTQKFKRLRSKK